MTNSGRPTLCTVLGVLAIIGAVFGVMGLLAVGGLALFAAGTGASFALIVATLLILIGVVLSIASAVGFFGMKKWMPILVAISLAINVVQYLITALGENGSFASGLLGLAISGGILWYVYAHKALFKN